MEVKKLKDQKLFINGKWEESQTGNTIPIINPATEKVITNVSEGGEADINRAVKAARKAFEEGPWSSDLTPYNRSIS